MKQEKKELRMYFTSEDGRIMYLVLPDNDGDVWDCLADYDDRHGTDWDEHIFGKDVLKVCYGAASEYPHAERGE